MSQTTDTMRNTVLRLFDHEHYIMILASGEDKCFVESSSTHPTAIPSNDVAFINYVTNLIYIYQDTPETQELRTYALLLDYNCYTVNPPRNN